MALIIEHKLEQGFNFILFTYQPTNQPVSGWESMCAGGLTSGTHEFLTGKVVRPLNSELWSQLCFILLIKPIVLLYLLYYFLCC